MGLREKKVPFHFRIGKCAKHFEPRPGAPRQGFVSVGLFINRVDIFDYYYTPNFTHYVLRTLI